MPPIQARWSLSSPPLAEVATQCLGRTQRWEVPGQSPRDVRGSSLSSWTCTSVCPKRALRGTWTRTRTRTGPVLASAKPPAEWGARDPFPAELASEFGEKTLGLADTEHRILMPDRLNEVTGLVAKSCQPITEDSLPLTEAEARELLKRVVGWKLVGDGEEDKGSLAIAGQWRVRGSAAGEELVTRIRRVVEVEGHEPQSVEYEDEAKCVIVRLQTTSLGGLTENDFILAAKIDRLDIKDLVPKARFWA